MKAKDGLCAIRDRCTFLPLTLSWRQFRFESGTIAAFLDTGSDSRAPIQMADESAFVYGNCWAPATIAT